ncbi:hypothetical protein [Candidatus Fukatsuia symbiotica]|uniref:Uncharacterized protein n=1 Tax=Candidatus Fukatsuia symbiotica TaxID=1878942 RepID=A0A2U8I2S1_9GAMM|nr:hypothetical protein CCS41_01055 [Candidatus Fukatsuia symbiotica]
MLHFFNHPGYEYEGWNNKAIAQALRIHEKTVRQPVTDWLSDEKLKPKNGGSYSKLSVDNSSLLEKHIESTTYTCVMDICAYVDIDAVPSS